MRKFNTFLPVIVVICLLLAACGTSQSESGTPGAYPTPQTNGEGTSTPEGLSSTGSLNGTPTVSSMTEVPTQPVTVSSPVPSTVSTQTVTSTQGVPSTGASSQEVDPGLLSNQLQFQVMDQQNQPLGKVSDIVLDLSNLKVAYVIVELSQITGTVAKEVAVPWNKLELQAASSSTSTTSATPAATAQPATAQPANSQGNSAQGAFVYTGDQQLLANAPEFSADSLPPLGQPVGTWDAALLSYWNGAGASSAVVTSTVTTPMPATPLSATETPSGSSSTPVAGQTSSTPSLQGVALASKVVGMSIMDSNNQEAAKVSDAVVDPTTGDLSYVILNANNKLIPVPPQDLGIDMQNQAVVLTGGSQVLQTAPSFDQGSFPQTTSPDWDANIKSFWQTQMQPTTQP